MNEYDIKSSIKRIEDELIASMIRNMNRHRVQEVGENKQWAMWQVEQLSALEAYKTRNAKKFNKDFGKINSSIPNIIAESRRLGNMEQEEEILKAIKKGWRPKKGTGDVASSFFLVNDQKMNALVTATKSDMLKAEQAILRRSNDAYRKIIFDAQMYATSGAGTYAQAVDMATKDFLSAGIQCVQYKNGAMHTLSDYADMAIRTASKRAYFSGEGEKRQEWGCHLVIVNKRSNPCPKCLPFVGKILIDDVWSGGSSIDGPYSLLSSAMAAGLYHPRCKDSHTTYFPGISRKPDDKFSKKEINDIKGDYKKEQKKLHKQRNEEKYNRLSTYSLDKANKEKYAGTEKQIRYSNTTDAQYFRSAKIDKDNTIKTAYKGLQCTATKVKAYDDIYVSDKLSLKPKEIHYVDSRIRKAKRIVGANETYNSPRIIICDTTELPSGVMASYAAGDNTLRVGHMLTSKERIKNTPRSIVSPDNENSTYVHEMIHWKDAQEYIKAHGSSKGYIKANRAWAKKQIEKLVEEGYNIEKISDYAEYMYFQGKYDETYAEYRTLKKLGG